MTNPPVITVLGGGSFGTAVANIAAENGFETYLWMRNSEKAQEIQNERENKQYLPGCCLHENLVSTSDMQTALSASSVVIVSIPSKSFREVLVQASRFIAKDAFVISTTKGIETGTFALMSDIIKEVLPENRVGVLSGPNLAKEIGKRYLTASVIASQDCELRAMIQSILGGNYFRIYANVDTYGVELGGALKNIYAIIAGLIDSLGYGQNTKAMIITRSLAEMSRFAVCLGANPLTFLGLAGVGDLIVTCESPLSRNYRVGFEIGKGTSLQEAVDSLGEVAEGINTLKLVKNKSEELQIYMPLVKGLHAILFENCKIPDVISSLMTAQQSTDVEFILPREE